MHHAFLSEPDLEKGWKFQDEPHNYVVSPEVAYPLSHLTVFYAT